MEPPIYADVNKASRYLDLSKLRTLGPFAKAIFRLLYCGNETDAKRVDAI